VRKITADNIYSNVCPAINNGVLIVKDDGTVLDLLDSKDGLEDVEYHSGALCPGFVNAHCHLELSHLFGRLPQKKGLLNFLKPIIKIRAAEEEVILSAMIEADQSMVDNGIVAVGDIGNESASFKLKSKSKIQYHNFVEVIGFSPEEAEEKFKLGLNIFEQSLEMDLPGSVVPHAPYSVSPELLARINERSADQGFPVCFHSQESKAELALFQNRGGGLPELYRGMGVNIDFFQPSTKSSLAWMASNLSSAPKLMAVHNTFSTVDDIRMAMEYFPNMYWCFCPNANLYIEDTTPDFSLFVDFPHRITIGTDSLASNEVLSILEEIKTISTEDSTIDLASLIKWATINGAEYLGMADKLGSFEKGKKPGVNLISSLAENGQRLTADSKVHKLA